MISQELKEIYRWVFSKDKCCIRHSFLADSVSSNLILYKRINLSESILINFYLGASYKIYDGWPKKRGIKK